MARGKHPPLFIREFVRNADGEWEQISVIRDGKLTWVAKTVDREDFEERLAKRMEEALNLPQCESIWRAAVIHRVRRGELDPMPINGMTRAEFLEKMHI